MGTKKKNTNNIGRSRASLIWHQFKKNKGAMVGLGIMIMLVIIALAAPLIWDYSTDISGMNVRERLKPPSWEHPFGTDHMGRDVFSRVCYGTRYSLLIGIVGVAISTIFGVSLGAIAGFYGGKVETVIMRCVEMMLMMPSILLTIVLVSAFGISLRNLMLALGIATIPHFARNARAAVMTVCNNEYVEASKAIGTPSIVTLFTHVLPNALSPILVQATTRMGGVIGTAASFSFLGLGVPAPTPEWGAMLSDARSYMWKYPYLLLFPGMAIFITCLAINQIGDGLRDALDPKLKR